MSPLSSRQLPWANVAHRPSLRQSDSQRLNIDCPDFLRRQITNGDDDICRSDFPIEIEGRARLNEGSEAFASYGGGQGFLVWILVGLSEREVKKERRGMGFLKKNSPLAFKPNGTMMDGSMNVEGASAPRSGGGGAQTGLAKSRVRLNPSGLHRASVARVCACSREESIESVGPTTICDETLEKARTELGQ